MSVFTTRRRVLATEVLASGRPIRWRQPWRWMPFGLRLRLARVRAWAARKRLIRRTLVIAGVLVAFTIWANAVTAAKATEQRWGEIVDVVVLAEAPALGEVITAEHLRLEARPVAFVPEDAFHEVDVVAGSVVTQLATDDVLRARDLRDAESALVVPDGRRALAIEQGPTMPAVPVGGRVDLHVIADPLDGIATPLETDGLVLEVGEEAIIVAVPANAVAAVAEGLLRNRVVVAAS